LPEELKVVALKKLNKIHENVEKKLNEIRKTIKDKH
jgi:hypothetical protein